MGDDETVKAACDAFVHGLGVLRDGKHVPIQDVYTTAKEDAADDLVKRLRYLAKDTEAYESNAMSEAADRIEALEAALQKIAQHDLQAIALDALRPGERAALAGEKKDE